ncbi:hypothetical protein MML48_10g00007981 [Holotrichia oblita]|uniref:Uncharacterized protein n=1 Tax=Holotrichia oblita TaxID=644536 RepID=A0ACB9SGL0_HOLOL|nr:hypothetical protein MML48_10g00007981 [Holotrichia oblita]
MRLIVVITANSLVYTCFSSKWCVSVQFNDIMTSCPMRKGLSNAKIPSNVLPNLQSEEDLEKALNLDNDNDTNNKESMTTNIPEENDLGSCYMDNDCDVALGSLDIDLTRTSHEDNNNEIQLNNLNASLIKRQRQEAHHALAEQAKKMKISSNKKFLPVTLGQTVKVEVPEVDRSKTDQRALLAVIMNIQDEEFYRLGTSAGILAQLFIRNQFTVCEENFITSLDVPANEISLRGAMRKMSLSGGQGFQRFSPALSIYLLIPCHLDHFYILLKMVSELYGVYDVVFGHLNIPEYITQKIYSSKLHRRDLEFLAAFARQNEKYFTFEDLIEVLEECNPYFNEETRHVICNEFNWLREPCSDVPGMTYMYDIATRSVLSLDGNIPKQNGNIVWEPPHENPILSNEEVCDCMECDRGYVYFGQERCLYIMDNLQ